MANTRKIVLTLLVIALSTTACNPKSIMNVKPAAGVYPPASESRNPPDMSDELWRLASTARAIRSSIYRCEHLGDVLA